MKKKAILICLLACTINSYLFSQEKEPVIEYNDDKKTFNKTYNEITVTADIAEEAEKKIPVPIKNYQSNYLNENSFTSMVDLLDSTSGFSTRYEYHSTLYLRGYSENNILFLQDGCRRTGNTPSGIRGNKLAAFNIEKVEIIKGFGSVVYGSGALTGIVNVVTTDIFKNKGFETKLKSLYATNNNEKDNSILNSYNNGTFAYNIGFRYRDADNYTLPDDIETQHSYLKDKDLVGKIGFKFCNNQKIILSSDIHWGGPWAKAAGFNGKPNLKVYYDQEDTYHFSLQYSAENTLEIDRIKLLLYFDCDKTKLGKKWYSTSGSVSSDNMSEIKDYYGGSSLHTEKKLGVTKLIIGCDSYFFRAWITEYEYSTISGPEPTYSETDSIQGGGTDSGGFFLQNIVSLNQITFQAGIRYDIARVFEGNHHASSLDSVNDYEKEKIRDAVSGNIGTTVNLNKNIFLKFNIGRAFRMPSYDEMYSERLTGKGIITGNPGIEPEYSTTIDLVLGGKIKNFGFETDGFVNFYDDLITSVETESGYIYQNIKRVRLYGLEAEIYYDFINQFGKSTILTPLLSLNSYVGDDLSDKSWLDFSDEDPLLYVPNSELNLKIRYTIKKLSLNILSQFEYNYAFRQNRVPEGEDPYPAYYYCNAILGIGTSTLSPFDNLKLYLTIKNITDNRYYRFNDYLPAKGRDFRISLNADF